MLRIITKTYLILYLVYITIFQEIKLTFVHLVTSDEIIPPDCKCFVIYIGYFLDRLFNGSGVDK